MKVSEITLEDIKQHLRVDFNDDDLYIEGLLISAKSYVKNYTGLDGAKIDTIAELTNVVLMIVADLYENRGTAGTSYKTGESINKIYDSMLNMHCVNLL
jgi:uncharacterized phage protein (predicted DNA packaging)